MKKTIKNKKNNKMTKKPKNSYAQLNDATFYRKHQYHSAFLSVIQLGSNTMKKCARNDCGKKIPKRTAFYFRGKRYCSNYCYNRAKVNYREKKYKPREVGWWKKK